MLQNYLNRLIDLSLVIVPFTAFLPCGYDVMLTSDSVKVVLGRFDHEYFHIKNISQMPANIFQNMFCESKRQLYVIMLFIM